MKFTSERLKEKADEIAFDGAKIEIQRMSPEA